MAILLVVGVVGSGYRVEWFDMCREFAGRKVSKEMEEKMGRQPTVRELAKRLCSSGLSFETSARAMLDSRCGTKPFSPSAHKVQ